MTLVPILMQLSDLTTANEEPRAYRQGLLLGSALDRPRLIPLRA